MSYFDDASLVMIPSGYKDQKVYSVKPIDGSGDLTFTRSNDTATRVGPDGLIEKVRTNLLLQSNTFSTTWTNNSSTETGGQAGYDGSNDAWLLTATDLSSAFVDQSLSTNSVVTFSVYAKANTADFVELVTIGGAGNPRAWFNLSTGSVGTSYNVIDTNIEAISSGWYRCSITLSGSIINYRFYAATSDNSTSIGIGDSIYIQDAQLETGDIATDYIATTTAAVSVGPVANLPRLDYSGGATCPSLLLEPQRTNLALYSENFDNAAYVKVNISVTANATTSPDGYTNADKIESTAAPAAAIELRQSFTLTAQSYVASVYLKQGSGSTDLSNFDIYNGGGSYQARTSLNFATGVLTQSIGTGASVVNVGNGWFRVLVPFTGYAGTNYIYIGNSGTYEASGKFVYAYGFQLEAGAYETSYINTLGAAVTRGVDLASKTGISSLIGQTEGTALLDFQYNGAQESIIMDIAASGLSPQERIILYQPSGGFVRFIIFENNVQQVNISSSSYAIGERLKVGIAYKTNDFAFYINGVQIGTDNLGSVPATSRIDIGNRQDGTYSAPISVNQTLLFTTRLTNAQLAELTTI